MAFLKKLFTYIGDLIVIAPHYVRFYFRSWL